ncbi:hypothetical protein SAMN06265340_102104 [Desulfurobacterium atlanticum]|uniref:Uncharacterized protein n=1 Tax=Desulfurobacterium atlanticum TaxID=240169 RepID=A0A238Y3W1_9BACT|nr:hypothetical protein SAMN06265340_102104 [Desulfurobacterium atlanticum]
MRERKLKNVKIVMHAEYNHELSKHHNRKRWIKENKKFYWKRTRRKGNARFYMCDSW